MYGANDSQQPIEARIIRRRSYLEDVQWLEMEGCLKEFQLKDGYHSVPEWECEASVTPDDANNGVRFTDRSEAGFGNNDCVPGVLILRGAIWHPKLRPITFSDPHMNPVVLPPIGDVLTQRNKLPIHRGEKYHRLASTCSRR
jgi:hypothetical protein